VPWGALRERGGERGDRSERGAESRPWRAGRREPHRSAELGEQPEPELDVAPRGDHPTGDRSRILAPCADQIADRPEPRVQGELLRAPIAHRAERLERPQVALTERLEDLLLGPSVTLLWALIHVGRDVLRHLPWSPVADVLALDLARDK